MPTDRFGDMHLSMDAERILDILRNPCRRARDRAYRDCIAEGRSEAGCRAAADREYLLCTVLDVESSLDEARDPCERARRNAIQRCLDEGGSGADCQAAGHRARRACHAMRVLAERRLHAAALQETLEPMLPPELEESARLWNDLFAKPGHAMTISQTIAQVLADAGIELREDETFTCLIAVARKPAYVSAVVPPPPPAGEAASRLVQILEPRLMQAVLDAVEKDKVPAG
ncbi:hypothetical protein SAMN05444722_3511 [Rhodovulum sp. ES.010]|uniref:hypothetical protein n=1 Tax=Rhodovulum sp. ES.010 TaxID=1882821 RepID=UPI000926A335|nr:hypothetical protein [Rhodovulum sp. ES.010]SIO55576.1 hypothetical protein SAMN05444722_3511 [Rhodovulum sp. ES.010]